MTDYDRAKIMYKCFNERFATSVAWDECGDAVQSFWLKTIEDCAEIGKGITYED